MLQNQVQIYSVDTGNFYTKTEEKLHRDIYKLKAERKHLLKGCEYTNINTKQKKVIIGINEIRKQLAEYGFEDFRVIDELIDERVDDEETNNSKSNCKSISECGILDRFEHDESIYQTVASLVLEYQAKMTYIKHKNKLISKKKEQLKTLLHTKLEYFETQQLRSLKENSVSKMEIISVFESFFTRTIGAKQDELCKDFLVVQIYYFDILKDLVYHGFMFEGEKYVYFTSSAGQIRTKKCVFVKENVWKKYSKTLMCGLSIGDINSKGGNNSNKFLAYLALSNSATDECEDFDIDKCIVVDDFENEVYGTFDFIDDTDYSITRKTDYVTICHTDGVGMCLHGKNRMIRLPWIKGLLTQFDFVKFIKDNNCVPTVKDIYGDEHDILAEGIEIIFFKSQFKMWKFYSSWQEYKKCYKKFHCTAGIANVEEDKKRNATINYQMLQTLTDVTDDELKNLARRSVREINEICNSVDNALSVFGATDNNLHKDYFQKALIKYPNLLNDSYTRDTIREIKNSRVKKYKSGKLKVDGKYTFVVPDMYAVCEYLFLGIKNPKGLLDDGEVSCKLYKQTKKLDCLRSPHLYKEHAVRLNAYASEDMSKQNKIHEWFITSAVYTSCHDLITRILQCDCDGDTLLIVGQKQLVNIAERNMESVVPLYYNMKKAQPCELSSESLCDGLISSFSSKDIGIYSNDISKIWNSEVFISGSEEEKVEALNIIKLLCMENNYCIDAAKTLYMPKRPLWADKLISKYTNCKLPHFFKYAKDKTEEQTESTNASLVNRLEDLIPNPRIRFKNICDEYLSKPDYKLLMLNPEIEVNVVKSNNGKLIKGTNPVILIYREAVLKIGYDFSNLTNKECPHDITYKSEERENFYLREMMLKTKKAFSDCGYTDDEIADILVKYAYGIKPNAKKKLLWLCYGEILYNRLCESLSKQEEYEQQNKMQEKKIGDIVEYKCPKCGLLIRHRLRENEGIGGLCFKCRDADKKKQSREYMRKYRQGT